jgi:hypothetical protein
MLTLLWRLLFGGCRHQYHLISKERVLTRPDGTFTSIDTAGKYVSHELFTFQCMCGKILTRRIDQVTGKIKCHSK